MGLLDDAKSLDGGMEVIDFTTGKVMWDHKETSRLCSISTLRHKEDVEAGIEREWIFCGTSEKKII